MDKRSTPPARKDKHPVKHSAIQEKPDGSIGAVASGAAAGLAAGAAAGVIGGLPGIAVGAAIGGLGGGMVSGIAMETVKEQQPHTPPKNKHH